MLVVTLMFGAALVALASDETGTYIGLGPKGKVGGTINGETTAQIYAGTMKFELSDSGLTLPTFCIDLHHEVKNGDTFITSDEVMSCNILWLLNNYPPRLSGSDWPDAPDAMANIKDEMAARQMAIWHYSDNFEPDDRTDSDIITRTWEIINAVPDDSCGANQPAIEIAPASAVNPINTTQSFTVTVTQGSNLVSGQVVTITADYGTLTPATVTTDDQGQATFTLTYGSPDTTSHITATSQMSLPVGTIFVGTDPNTQKLVLGEGTLGLVQSYASATWIGNSSVTTLSFVDYDMDGVHDAGEPTLEGWTVELEEYNGTSWQSVDTKLTNADGAVGFTGLTAGQYRVIETLESGWYATTPLTAAFDLETDESYSVDFGQVKLPVIIGHVYQDDNRDATYDTGELSLEDWELRLYREDGSEVVGMQGFTGADGRVVFSSPPDRDPPDIVAGTYFVQETLKDGWIATGGISRTVTVAADDVKEVHVGNYELASVRPIMECVVNNFNGTYTAYFGYLNENDFAVDIPIGDENYFHPDPQDRGQPTTFDPGRTPYWPNAAYSTVFGEDQTLVWHLDGRTATASSGSVPCSNHVFLDKVWYDATGSPLDAPPVNVDDFEITAESELGTATCTYPSGSTELVCVYDNQQPPALDNNGLWVPLGTPYTVTESGLPAGWTLGDGVGTYLVSDGYCEPGVEGHAKYCLHTVENQDVAPTIVVTKDADPTSLPEPGGEVTFNITVANTSAEPLTIVSLQDSVYGDLNGQGTCSVGASIPAGGEYACSFATVINGNAGFSETDVVTASTEDADGNTAEGSDDATVTITDVPSSISVTKTASPTEVAEPGGDVAFTVVVENTSAVDSVTIDSLMDDIHGDLDGQGDCSVPQTIPAGASYTCSFTVQVTGNAGDTETDVVTATGTDDDGNAVSDSDDATVTITDVPSSISVTKTASPTEVAEPGGDVAFTVVVENTSAVDSVTIDSLMDDIHGDLDGQGDCSVPQTIPAGASYTCSFTVQVTGNAGDTETDVVTAEGTDDDGDAVSDSDDATVTITDVPSSISVTKTASPTEVAEPGGDVAFTVVVENTSAVDSVTIDSLMDDIHGDLDGQGTCSVPQTIPAGDATVATRAAWRSRAATWHSRWWWRTRTA